jgi:hypothetical protein
MQFVDVTVINHLLAGNKCIPIDGGHWVTAFEPSVCFAEIDGFF